MIALSRPVFNLSEQLRRRLLSVWLWPLMVLACCACIGCGSSEPFDYVKAQGSVSYEDGSPIPAGGMRLLFISLDAEPVGNAYPRPATAIVNGDGKFDVVTSYKYGDGLLRGKQKVAVFYATDKNGNLLVPKEYANVSTTPLTIDVQDSGYLDIKFPRIRTGGENTTSASESASRRGS